MAKDRGRVKAGPKTQIPGGINPLSFVGVDPSYTGTGVVILSTEGSILKQGVIRSNPEKDKEDRIIWIANEIICAIDGSRSPVVFMEAPAFYAEGNALIDMGALNFYIRIRMRQIKLPYAVISPTSLKKFVCGSTKGTGSKKELMLMLTYKRWGVEFRDNNLCDAHGLAQMAREHYTTTPKTKLRLRE